MLPSRTWPPNYLLHGHVGTGGTPGLVVTFTGMILNQMGEKDSKFILFLSSFLLLPGM